MSWLLDVQIKPWLSRKRQGYLSDVLRLYGVEQRVTVLDDRADVHRDEDVQRLRDVSDVVALSDRQTLYDLLLAA